MSNPVTCFAFLSNDKENISILFNVTQLFLMEAYVSKSHVRFDRSFRRIWSSLNIKSFQRALVNTSLKKIRLKIIDFDDQLMCGVSEDCDQSQALCLFTCLLFENIASSKNNT